MRTCQQEPGEVGPRPNQASTGKAAGGHWQVFTGQDDLRWCGVPAHSTPAAGHTFRLPHRPRLSPWTFRPSLPSSPSSAGGGSPPGSASPNFRLRQTPASREDSGGLAGELATMQRTFLGRRLISTQAQLLFYGVSASSPSSWCGLGLHLLPLQLTLTLHVMGAH